jgi:hypothetical protein
MLSNFDKCGHVGGISEISLLPLQGYNIIDIEVNMHGVRSEKLSNGRKGRYPITDL